MFRLKSTRGVTNARRMIGPVMVTLDENGVSELVEEETAEIARQMPSHYAILTEPAPTPEANASLEFAAMMNDGHDEAAAPPALEDTPMPALKALAKERGINCFGMTKVALIDALKE